MVIILLKQDLMKKGQDNLAVSLIMKDKIIVITISGRGDKDVYSIAKYRGADVVEQ